MSPVTKFEDHPAVSLLLVKPAPDGQTSNTINLTPATDSGDQTSRAALMQMIYELMLLIGENMSEIQKANAQTQLEQAKIAQNSADGAKASSDRLIKELDKLHKKQEEAKTEALVGTIMKWVGVALALIIGALLCETPLGFIILAATIAFTASPLFDMAVKGLTTLIEKIPGIPPEWAKVIAEVLIIVAVTVVSFGAEAATVGTKLGITAVEDVTNTATQLAVKGAEQSAEEISEESIEEVSEEASSQASNKTDETPEEAPKTQNYRTAATTNAFVQTLMASNLIPTLISNIPGIKKYPWLVAILSVLAELLVALAAYKVTPTASSMNMLGRLSGLADVSETSIKAVTAAISGLVAIVTNVGLMAQGYNELEQSAINKKIAPIQSELMFEDGFMQLMQQLITLSQQTYKQSMVADQEIFKIDFSADMRGCVNAQYQA